MLERGIVNYIELARVIVAKKMKIPPDDIDMLAIFKCVQMAIEEQVENNLEEPVLSPASEREIKAVISEIGEKIILMMINNEYPFKDFMNNYKIWYKENMVGQFLKMKMRAMEEEKEK